MQTKTEIIMQTRKQQNKIFKVLKGEKNYQSKILYPKNKLYGLGVFFKMR